MEGWNWEALKSQMKPVKIEPPIEPIRPPTSSLRPLPVQGLNPNDAIKEECKVTEMLKAMTRDLPKTDTNAFPSNITIPPKPRLQVLIPEEKKEARAVVPIRLVACSDIFHGDHPHGTHVSIDHMMVELKDRVLLCVELNAGFNGVWTVERERWTPMFELGDAILFVEEGTNYSGTRWLLSKTQLGSLEYNLEHNEVGEEIEQTDNVPLCESPGAKETFNWIHDKMPKPKVVALEMNTSQLSTLQQQNYKLALADCNKYLHTQYMAKIDDIHQAEEDPSPKEKPVTKQQRKRMKQQTF